MLSPRCTLYLLFFLSGASGLIYESAWANYLGLFLGHAAYAQALVLSIFMGGLAFGAWLSNRFLPKWGNLLLAYAVVEGLVGLFGLVFHGLFVGFLDFSHERVLPALDHSFLILLYKWGSAAALILPQCVLLGMSFPLMSNGMLRQFPGAPGRTISILYFVNSFGAALGVLCAGFVLLGWSGLPGTMMTAALINIFVALGAYAVARRTFGQSLGGWSVSPAPGASGAVAEGTATRRVLIVVTSTAALTGLASFVYEIVWIRRLSMVLGASTHAFELMLSAFISGLAIGGLVVSFWADRLQHPLRCAAWVQIVMALMAVLTLPLYDYTFELMGFFMSALQRNDQGYALFNLYSHMIALLVMLPTTICAGMTLPLLTLHLARCRGYSERSIGTVYAANTVGALTAVYVTVFWGLPRLTAGGSLLGGVVIDAAVGLALLCWLATRRRELLSAFSLVVLVVVIGVSFVKPDLHLVTSGVFRYGLDRTSVGEREIRFYRDGPALSTSVHWDERNVLVLSNNGKPDAGVHMAPDQYSLDEPTMVMLGLLPLLHEPDARWVGNIGLGAGITVHTVLAASQAVEGVDTVEIEPAVIEAARWFHPYSKLAHEDPRSHLHVEDAKTFFSNRQRQYDIIISEPPNPWSSGVANLFTEEFYHHIKRHLRDGGVFTQWMHAYELNSELFALVINALSKEFPYARFYVVGKADIVILASTEPLTVAQYPQAFFDQPSEEWAKVLRKMEINGPEDVWPSFVGTQALIYPWAGYISETSNSDYFPVLDLQAVKARFKGNQVGEMMSLHGAWLPIFDWFHPESSSLPARRGGQANDMLSVLLAESEPQDEMSPDVYSDLVVLRDDLLAESCTHWREEKTVSVRSQVLTALTRTLRHAAREQNRGFLDLLRGTCAAQLFPRYVDWHEALVEGDMRGVERSAGLLYEQEEMLPEEKVKVLESRFLAAVVVQDYPLAAHIARLYRDDEEFPVPYWMQVLLALVAPFLNAGE